MTADAKILYQMLHKLNLIIDHLGIESNFAKFDGIYCAVLFPFKGTLYFQGTYEECYFYQMKFPDSKIVPEAEFKRLRNEYIAKHPELYKRKKQD